MAKRMEYDKLILNSCNKAKTTWDIINKESGRKKKRSEIQALKVQDKKITDQQNNAENLTCTLYPLQKISTNRRKVN